MKHSLIMGLDQKVHPYAVQIVSEPRTKKRICCSFGGRVRSWGRTKRAIVVGQKGGLLVSLYGTPAPSHSMRSLVWSKSCKQSHLRLALGCNDLREWSRGWNKRMSSLLNMGRGRRKKEWSSLPKGSVKNARSRQTDCLLLFGCQQ